MNAVEIEEAITHLAEQPFDAQAFPFAFLEAFGNKPVTNLRNWVDAFPYVNGGLFAGNKEIPRFSRIARSYLLHAGRLNWKEINPDIFGSMINDTERLEKLFDLYTKMTTGAAKLGAKVTKGKRP